MKLLPLLFTILPAQFMISCGEAPTSAEVSHISAIQNGPKDGYKSSAYAIGRPIKCSYKSNKIFFPSNWDCEVERFKISGKEGFDGIRRSYTAISEEVAKKFDEYGKTGESYIFQYVERDPLDIFQNPNNRRFFITDIKPLATQNVDNDSNPAEIKSVEGRRGNKTKDGVRRGYIVLVHRETRWFPSLICKVALHEGGFSKSSSGTGINVKFMNVYSEEACQKLETLINYNPKVEVKYSEAYNYLADNRYILHEVSLLKKEDTAKVNIKDMSLEELKQLLLQLLDNDKEVQEKVKELTKENN